MNTDQWQPIETAPKDKSDVLLYDGDEITIGYHSTFGGWMDKTDPEDRWDFRPTHWMPLPSLPTT